MMLEIVLIVLFMALLLAGWGLVNLTTQNNALALKYAEAESRAFIYRSITENVFDKLDREGIGSKALRRQASFIKELR